MSLCASLRGTAWGSRIFFYQLGPCWVLQQVVGIYLPHTGILGWGAWSGAGSPHSQDIPPDLLAPTHGWETSWFCICTPPTSLNGCGFFNSVVVRLPFNLVSGNSEWWLYILAVILMWLCRDVCLCRHLDWKSLCMLCLVCTFTSAYESSLQKHISHRSVLH